MTKASGQLSRILSTANSEILDASKSWISCPGEHLHTTQTKKADCMLFFNPDGSIVAHCFHTSCDEQIRALNERLRSAWRGSSPVAHGAVAVGGIKRLSKKEDHRLRDATSKLLQKFRWTYDAIKADSPVRIHDPPPEHWRYILKLFRPDDIVWCGPDIECSGMEWHRRWFRKASVWLQERKCPGAYTCPSIFLPGTYSRANRNVVERRFMVVESDSLARDEVGAVFRAMMELLDLRLQAIVDTAGKSLHGWFDYPGDQKSRDLKEALPQLGCDPAMFKLSQPCRLPGWLRESKYQQLIYLNHNSTK